MYFADCLLRNSFSAFGHLVFNQIKGAPQGGNTLNLITPLLADIFLAILGPISQELSRGVVRIAICLIRKVAIKITICLRTSFLDVLQQTIDKF